MDQRQSWVEAILYCPPSICCFTSPDESFKVIVASPDVPTDILCLPGPTWAAAIQAFQDTLEGHAGAYEILEWITYDIQWPLNEPELRALIKGIMVPLEEDEDVC